MNYTHKSVLLDESIEGLDLKPGGTYVDATMGGGGHSYEIAKKIGKEGTLIGIDQDDFAQEYAQNRLKDLECNKIFVKDNFVNLEKILDENGIEEIDGIIYDLGVSSFQLDDEARGFSYHNEGPLDMRMDKTQKISAKDIVNNYSKEELVRVLRDYGEERFAPRIADRIIKAREEKPIETTLELSEIVKAAYPAKERHKKKHPARKTFQALRIEVNKELDILRPSLTQAIKFLKPGGRISVITFHSLEDRIVKHFFKEQLNPCTCPPEFPMCMCGKKPQIKLVNRKPILPKADELEVNNRARSAKLRVIEKLDLE